MNIERLQIDVQKKQQALKALEASAMKRDTQRQTCKGEARSAKLEYKKARKKAKQAKELFLEATERVEKQRQVLAKAQKRLAKAMRRDYEDMANERLLSTALGFASKPVRKSRTVRRVAAKIPKAKASRHPASGVVGAALTS